MKAQGKGKEYTEEKINEAVEELQDGEPITVKRISSYTGLSLRAVYRYVKPFLSVIDDYNEQLKDKKNTVDSADKKATDNIRVDRDAKELEGKRAHVEAPETPKTNNGKPILSEQEIDELYNWWR